MGINGKGEVSVFAIVAVAVAFLVGGVVGWFIKPPDVIAPIDQLNQDRSNLSQTRNAVVTASQENLSKDMRKLWEDHITWTRAYLVSAAFNNKDATDVSERLLKNQEDIGNSIKPYYGIEAGDKLTSLLKTHITTAVELVTAVKTGSQNAQTAANDKWYANANEIADFLASANPNWPKDEMRIGMKEHLDLTKQEAVDILGNKYEVGIADYDKVHVQILKMADMLTEGIVKQFPDKFK